MKEEDRKAWLASLRPGDEVAMPQEGLGPKSYWICRVKHVTPTRKRIDIVTPYDQLIELREDGYAKSMAKWSRQTYIVPVTAEVRLLLRAQALQAKLDRAILNSRNRIREDLTISQMERILTILEEPNGPDPEQDRPEPHQDP